MEIQLTTESDRSPVPAAAEQIEALQRELDDTTDQLVVSCLQRIELEKAVRAAADRIRHLEARLTSRSGSHLRAVPDTHITDAAAEAAAEPDPNVYVFDDEDRAGKAFDEFFSAHDPHLDKVRRFLLG